MVVVWTSTSFFKTGNESVVWITGVLLMNQVFHYCVIFLLVRLACFVVPVLSFRSVTPGTGLSRSNISKQKDGNNEEVLIFEHTQFGSGGFVLHCPTPIFMKDLPIPWLEPFGHLPLMLGCGLSEESSLGGMALGELSPWFWVHDLPDLSGSYKMEGAAGPLYMGGNIEEAQQYLNEKQLDPAGHFQFFRRYKSWSAGELEEEIENGLWEVSPQDPERALEYRFIRIV